jgi:hypothetical protein
MFVLPGRRSRRAWWRGGDGGRRPGRGPGAAGCQRVSHFCGTLRRARDAHALREGRARGAVGSAVRPPVFASPSAGSADLGLVV